MPITPGMLAAVEGIRPHFPLWEASDLALTTVRSALPHHSFAEARVKATIVNGLYSTYVLALDRMAAHIAAVMASRVGISDDPPEYALVENLAAPPKGAGKKRFRHFSFASKYAHFFISGAYPIYDSVALRMVRWHLGREAVRTDAVHPYLSFIENLSRLRKRDALDCTESALDHYLWLAGTYRAWAAGERKLNNEALRVFEHRDAELAGLLQALCPDLEE